MIVPTLLLAATLALSAGQESSCSMDAENIEKEVLACAVHEPLLMFQIAEMSKNPEQMNSMKFVCDHKHDLVKMFICLEKKLASCMPAASKTILQYLPHENQLDQAMDFMCSHRNVFSSSCMTPQMSMQVSQCQQRQIRSLLASSDFSSPDAIRTGLCRVVEATENCFAEHRGTCSMGDVQVVDQLLEMLFPFKGCHKVSQGNLQLKADLFGNKRGNPLRFKPNGRAPYQINRGY